VPDALALIANAAGKLTREGLRATGRGATALPGLVALTLDPNFIRALSAELEHGVACVSGTNGKTTTARMLADISRTAGWEPIHNRSGSNLDRGVAAALLAQTTWYAEPRGNFGLFEIDEASLPSAIGRLQPRVVVVTNLFRDQMDRYFELDALARRIGEALAGLPAETALVLNADDPLVANLALRKDALRRYEEAVSAGLGAGLLDQERPDVFTQTVSAIPAHGTIEDQLPKFKEMLAEAGRSLADCPITMFGVAPDADLIKRYRDLGITRVVGGCPPEPGDKTLPLLDKWALIIRQVNS